MINEKKANECYLSIHPLNGPYYGNIDKHLGYTESGFKKFRSMTIQLKNGTLGEAMEDSTRMVESWNNCRCFKLEDLKSGIVDELISLLKDFINYENDTKSLIFSDKFNHYNRILQKSEELLSKIIVEESDSIIKPGSIVSIKKNSKNPQFDDCILKVVSVSPEYIKGYITKPEKSEGFASEKIELQLSYDDVEFIV